MKQELTYDDRAAWGECPVCKAPHGVSCNSEIGFPVGKNVFGESPKNGVHLGRLQNAPATVDVDLYAQLLLRRLNDAE